MRRTFLLAATLGTLLTLSALGFQGAHGQEELPPKNRVVLGNLFVLRLNPIGLEDQIRLGYQRRLSDRKALLFRDTFVFLGVNPKLNPAYVKLGPSIEIQPLTIFNLHLAAEYMGVYGIFGYLQSFQSPQSEYSDSLMSCQGLLGLRKLSADQCNTRANYGAGGAHVIIEPQIQLKFGPIALRNRFSIEYWRMGVRDGDTVFYDPTLDTLVPVNGWVLSNDLDLVFVTKFRFVIGARYSMVQPIYQDGDYQPGDPSRDTLKNGHHRIGLLAAYTFFDRGFTRFNKPTILLVSSWYVSHRYRAGQDVSQGVPYLLLGFAFQSDLLRPPPGIQ